VIHAALVGFQKGAQNLRFGAYIGWRILQPVQLGLQNFQRRSRKEARPQPEYIQRGPGMHQLRGQRFDPGVERGQLALL
jgi:hypothetical protein